MKLNTLSIPSPLAYGFSKECGFGLALGFD